jgi:hypothetical protein
MELTGLKGRSRRAFRFQGHERGPLGSVSNKQVKNCTTKSLPDGRSRFARGLAPLPPAGEGLVLSLRRDAVERGLKVHGVSAAERREPAERSMYGDEREQPVPVDSKTGHLCTQQRFMGLHSKRF